MKIVIDISEEDYRDGLNCVGMEDDFREWLKNGVILPAQEQTKWIPCSEKLPKEERKAYLVCTDSGDQYVCMWTNRRTRWEACPIGWHWAYTIQEVVAWMPLPEPYKVESEE